jgi:hypothetical protein
VRSPRSILLLLAVLATVAFAGCGGGEVEPDEVPGGPVTLTVPTDPDAGGSGTAADGASTTGDTAGDDSAADDDTTSSTGTGTDTTASAPTATPTAVATATPAATTAPTTGGTGTTDTTDSATNDTPPAEGSAPQQFEDFCEQNAGAC